MDEMGVLFLMSRPGSRWTDLPFFPMFDLAVE